MADTGQHPVSNGLLKPWLVILLINVVHGGEYCVHYLRGIRYCKYGCCGSTFEQYCCLLATWIIVLIVLIGLGVIFVIAVVFVCFYCKKRGRTRGSVIPASTQPTNTIAVSNVQYPQYGYGQPPPPYPYQQGVNSYGNPGTQPPPSAPPSGSSYPPPYGNQNGQGGSSAQPNGSSYPPPFGAQNGQGGVPGQPNNDFINSPVTGAQLDPAYPPPSGIYDSQYVNNSKLPN